MDIRNSATFSTYRDDIKAMQDAGFSVQWGHWALTACRQANGWPIGDVIVEPWPVGHCGPCDMETGVRNRVAAALRSKAFGASL